MEDLICPRMYSCYKCRNHVALHDHIVSKGFQKRPGYVVKLQTCHQEWCKQLFCNVDACLFDDQSKNGRAFLFSHGMNMFTGRKEDRQLMTGLHIVCDVYCGDCKEVLGWKYEKAYEDSQKYKEGKVVLEKYKIVREHW